MDNKNVINDYENKFIPSVHRIGRITMVIALFLVFLPVIYFYFIKGYKLPGKLYLNSIITVSAVAFGMWITEPLVYWPTLGSASTYMAYLSGNVGGMRFPVALSVQSALDADPDTPKGQVATIVGVTASVFTNLLILLFVILAGDWLLANLPDQVVAAFAFVMPSMMACLLVMRISSGKSTLKRNALDLLPYIITSMGTRIVIDKFFPEASTVGNAISVILCISVSYVIFKSKQRKKSE